MALDFRTIQKRYEDGTLSGWSPPASTETENALMFASHRALMKDADKKEVFLWRALSKVIPTWLPQYQQDGTCVGQGHKLAADDLMAIGTVFEGLQWVGRCSVAGCYAGGRVDIAGQPGSWQGSNGSWAAKWLTQYGILMLKDVGLPEDSRRDDELLALKWTKSRDGVPSEFETAAHHFPIAKAALVTTPEEVAVALQNGYPVTICTNLIPRSRRDKDGFVSIAPGGGHCTLIRGVRYDRPGFLYQNSWDVWASGPKYPEDQPDGSVWISWADLARILRSRDCWAFSGPQGFVRRKLKFKLI